MILGAVAIGGSYCAPGGEQMVDNITIVSPRPAIETFKIFLAGKHRDITKVRMELIKFYGMRVINEGDCLQTDTCGTYFCTMIIKT